MTSAAPRVVFVVRETDYELLLARHATRQQTRFFLQTRGQDLDALEAAHDQFQQVLQTARSTVPTEWRQALVKRHGLDRFLFAKDDVVVAIGQDGLIANVAKYLDGQPVIGINSAPEQYDGVLMQVPLASLAISFKAAISTDPDLEVRTMAEARLDSGERLFALNEVFIGHRSHQSARYTLEAGERSERQSSSGVIVATGTGATGWARSIMEATNTKLPLSPTEPALGFFVREPFPSVATGTSLRSGKVGAAALRIRSQMNEGGVIFADGIEQDYLSFDWGRELTVGIADRRLRLVRV